MYRGDQREEHDSGSDISLDHLKKLGVIYKEIPIDQDGQWEKEIDAFAKERGYKNVRLALLPIERLGRWSDGREIRLL